VESSRYPYPKLRKEIHIIAAKKPAAIVDISAVGKQFMGDLVAVSVLEGLDSLFTFDLLKPPDFDHPWTTLFHELKDGVSGESKYRYVNVLDTQVFRECSRSLMVKRPPLYISIVLGFLLLVGVLLAEHVFGASSRIVQSMSILASIASLLSLLYLYFPFRP
jgi:hypothetical protein